MNSPGGPITSIYRYLTYFVNSRKNTLHYIRSVKCISRLRDILVSLAHRWNAASRITICLGKRQEQRQERKFGDEIEANGKGKITPGSMQHPVRNRERQAVHETSFIPFHLYCPPCESLFGKIVLVMKKQVLVSGIRTLTFLSLSSSLSSSWLRENYDASLVLKLGYHYLLFSFFFFFALSCYVNPFLWFFTLLTQTGCR